MRNAGDGVPGGSSSRRQRSAAAAPPARPGGNGGASLFTPAYRVRHAAAGTRPLGQSASDPAGQRGRTADYDRPEADRSGYSWAESSQPLPRYRQSGYDRGDGGPGWPEDDLPGGYSWAADTPDDADPWSAGGPSGLGYAQRPVPNAVRGLPPGPDEPLPAYPPGPFAAWNRGTAERGRPDHADRYDPRARSRRDGSARDIAAATITPDEFDTDYSLPAIKDPVLGSSGSSRSGPDHGRGPRSSTDVTRGKEPVARSASQARKSGHGRTSRPGRGRGASSARRRTHAKHQSAWLAIGAAAVIIAAVTAVLFATSLSGTKAPVRPSNAPRSASPSPTQPAGKWVYIGSRTTDPIPLTMHELFPVDFVNAGVYYGRVTMQKSRNCAGALIGSALQAAVRKAGCTQALRASYLSRVGKVMATIGVFNLSTAAKASTAALHTGRQEFVAQLVTRSGLTHKLGQGTGIEEALVKGHYLVSVWAEFTDLTAPKTAAQRAALENFMNLLISRTVNASLSYRMISGEPTPPGA
ncbi:MAG TPA: hypothetical protein VNF47_28585 [Streptosporangiaceae bacterium]|nr:hypothetical protein [Streptosporangiaceae bacterium]